MPRNVFRYGIKDVDMRFLHLFSSSLGKSPRPTRFYSLLRSLGSVTVCAAPAVEGIEPPEHFLDLARPSRTLVQKMARACALLCHRYEADIWSRPRRAIYERLKGQDFSAVICQEALLVPLALAIRDARGNKKTPCPVLLDAREYYPREFEQSVVWNTLLGGINRYVCRKYFPQVDYIFTVSPGLAEGYRTEYGLECEVLPSFPYYQDISLDQKHDDGVIRCIHHGVASSGRRLEYMIEAFRMLKGRAALDVMLVPNEPAYYKKLRHLAQNIPNVFFREPVAMADIVPQIANYDVGVFFLPNNTFNHRHCLPNKFFEYVQARLALAISPLPDMSNLLRKYDLGVVSQDFTPQSFAAAIDALTPDALARFRSNADRAAHDFCWERNNARLREVILELLDVNPDSI